MGHFDDDDLAEIDTTPEQYARYKARSEPAKLIEQPAGTSGVTYIGTIASLNVRLTGINLTPKSSAIASGIRLPA